MKGTKEQIETVVLEACRELGEDMGLESLAEVTLETRLYGEKSGLDSFALVAVVTEVEERINEVFEVEISLADDRAMSRLRSPFRRVATLVEFIQSRLNEADGA